MKDYICYIHTDSLAIKTYQWLLDNNIDENKWDSLTLEKQLDYIKRISKVVEDYVNERTYEETQKLHFNSQEEQIKISFEQEKIALSGVFKDKGRYATWTLTDGGKWHDDMNVTGFEIIRSDSPEIVKPMIKQVLKMILKSYKDKEIKKYISKCKKELKKCKPEEIAENKGINKLEKYELSNYSYKKGTPHQIKGVIHFKYLLNKFDLESEYEVPQKGNKSKVVYLRKNPYNIDSLSFLTWPKEFDKKGIEVDYEKMVQNNFTKKLESLLDIVGKQELLNDGVNINSMFK